MPLISRILLLSLCFTQLISCSRTEQQTAISAAAVDLSKDAQYSKLVFGKHPGEIDIGVQPMALPESPVGLLLARDRVLAAQLAAAGTTLTAHPFLKGADLNFFLTRGDLEVGIAGDMPALAAAAKGDIVIVGMVKQGFSSIVARQPMLVKDLKGKRVATGLGSTSHFSLLNALSTEGLTEKDITIVPMEARDMPAALAGKKVDAFCAWEPTPSIAFAENQGLYLVHKGLSLAFLYFRKDFVVSHPEQTRQITAAAARSLIWMRTPGNLDTTSTWCIEAAAGFLGKPFTLAAARVATLIRTDLLQIPNAPLIDDRMLKENGLLWQEFNFLKNNGNIPQNVGWDKVRGSFDTEMMRQVLADRKRYALDRFDYRSSAPAAKEVSQ
jgi:NitT/TauT family transport system substrate-binding protein